MFYKTYSVELICSQRTLPHLHQTATVARNVGAGSGACTLAFTAMSQNKYQNKYQNRRYPVWGDEAFTHVPANFAIIRVQYSTNMLKSYRFERKDRQFGDGKDPDPVHLCSDFVSLGVAGIILG